MCRSGYSGDGLVCVGAFGLSVFSRRFDKHEQRIDDVRMSEHLTDLWLCLGPSEMNPCLEGNGGCHMNADCVHVGPNKVKPVSFSEF